MEPSLWLCRGLCDDGFACRVYCSHYLSFYRFLHATRPRHGAVGEQERRFPAECVSVERMNIAARRGSLLRCWRNCFSAMHFGYEMNIIRRIDPTNEFDIIIYTPNLLSLFSLTAQGREAVTVCSINLRHFATMKAAYCSSSLNTSFYRLISRYITIFQFHSLPPTC